MKELVNQDILAGKWKQARGRVKQWWGKLTDNDIERINGRVEELIGSLQEVYGYTRQEAENEVERFLEQFNK
ncbi:MAG: CsbD family protein [Anaerolineales bacterium]|nr:CsbD family protein [Anaerolineales bacterium]